MEERRIEDYADIIDHDYRGSVTHPRMAEEKRAAQFSPFAALTGYEDAVDETVREQEELAEQRNDPFWDDWQEG
ncbi:MAG: hypothetical protein K6G16_09545 [Lachnospiraceae bacterium]|nr:hypothetical protein [Lachnospiraceae bacterium]